MEDYDNVSHDSDSLPDKDLGNGETKVEFTTGSKTSPKGKNFSKSTTMLREKYQQSLPEHAHPIRVTPSEINFDSIDVGVLYVMTFSVRNASNEAQRIRIKAPKSMYFALNYIPLGVVAPGMEARGEIECQIPEGATDVRFFDTIEVSMGSSVLTAQLVATKLSPDVRFNNFVNLGFVAESQVSTVPVVFTNDSNMAGDTTLTPSAESKITIKPTKFVIPAHGSVTVSVSYEGGEIGPWREMVEVHTVGSLALQFMDVSVQTVDQKLTLLADENGGILETHDFGSMYYGTERMTHALLVNTGPQQLSYAITYQDEEDAGKLAPQTEEGGETKAIPLEKLMSVTPRQGIIKPFSQVKVKIVFKPVMPPPQKGFVSKFVQDTTEVKQVQRRVFVDCLEMNQRLNLNLIGTTSAPAVNVSPSILRFGNCPVHDRRDILVQLTNKSDQRTNFDFSSIAHFKMQPRKGYLEPRQTTSVIASFTPAQLGVFKHDMQLSIENGLIVKQIHILAESDSEIKKTLVGGTDKLPEDFKKIYKFVDPEEIASMRKLRQEGKKLNRVAGAPFHRLQDDKIFQSKSTVDDMDMDKVYGNDDESKVSIDSTHPLKQRQANDKIYTNYLQKSAAKRKETMRKEGTQRLLAKGGCDRNDPFGVDMGMDRGLDEPDLPIPKAGEPLWLADSSEGGKKSRPALDENRLIQKKYPATPATQAEMRDCSTELNGEDLAMISASHKVMDFGRVCVGSQSIKSLSITNELSSSVLCKLEELESEMKLSSPSIQVVPGGAVAGFDIYFNSKQLGKYKKKFIWKMNGHHSFTVVVLAEVVPIELEMSKKNLDFIFSENSIENFISQDVLLKNIGNAPADYLWGNAGAFECKPDKGNIGPGQTAIVSVVWTPQVDKRNEEELGLHIPGGIDQTLSVAGTVLPMKVGFEKGRLNIGSVAVGAELKMDMALKNTGTNAAVFFINPLDDRLGIRVSPERGLIEPGEKFVCQVTVVAKVSMSYDNVLINVSIRGNKPISMKMSGESVVPVIELAQTVLDMPTIAVGSEYRAPMTLTNKSTINASCVLNLKKYPDFKPCVQKASHFVEVTNNQVDSKGNSVTLIEDKDAAASGRPATENIWKITLAPGNVLEASLVYCPRTVKASNTFKLPLNILGMENGNQFNCNVQSCSVVSRLGISDSVVEFGDRVVSRDPMSRASYFLEVYFKNVGDSGFSYEIREAQDDDTSSKESVDDGVPPTFFISPTRGDIAPGGNTPIRLTFQPQESGTFNKRLEVFITDQPSPKIPYFNVFVRGSGVFPRMSFSSHHVELPTVPLDTTSRAQFQVINNGYQALTLKYKISPAITVPLELTFPDGQEIGISRESIRVIVSCRCPTAVSWAGSIEFSDEDGERFTTEVSGCAENSILTNYGFVKSYSEGYGFLGLDGQPINFIQKKYIQELRAADAKKKELLRKQRSAARAGKNLDGGPSQASEGSAKSKGKGGGVKKEHSIELPGGDGRLDENEGIDLDFYSSHDEDLFNDAEARFVLKWLNRNAMANPFDEERFPECILETHGDLMLSCIEQMSGKKVPGVTTGVPSEAPPPSRMGTGAKPPTPPVSGDPHAAAAGRMLKKYQTMIAHLTKAGALLTHVNPIDLLDQRDHMAAQATHAKITEGKRFNANTVIDRQAGWGKNWKSNCKAAWMEVIFQMIKVYALGRVNFPDYCKMPGISVPQVDEEHGKKSKANAVPPEFGRSNVYSLSESLLLAWATSHMNHAGELKDEGGVASDDKMFGVRRRTTDLAADLGSLVPFLQLVHSHMPDTALFGGHLIGYTTLKKDDGEAIFEKITEMLTDIRMMFDFTPEECAASGRTLLLMLLHMYLNLPSLLAKAKIEFSGVLGGPIKKNISLKNPSRKAVTYLVTMTGDTDFVLSGKEITVPPMSSADFLVTLNARFFNPVSAKITFWGVRENGLAGKTIVFQCISNIVGRKPIQSIHHKLTLFEMGSIEMAVASPFPKDVTVPVKILCHHTPMTVEEAIGGMKASSKQGGTPVADVPPAEAHEDYEIESNFKNPFWPTEENIPLSLEGPKPLQINMLPFAMGLYTCHIVLKDNNFGEFTYEVVLEVGLPKSSDTLGMKAFTDGSATQRMLRISSKNYAVDKAMGLLTDTRMANSSKKGRVRAVISSLLGSPVDNDALGTSQFVLNVSSPYFQLPKSLNMLSEYAVGGAMGSTAKPTTAKKVSRTVLDELAGGENPNNLPANAAILNFNPDKAGTYNTSVIAYSRQNRYDIRFFEINSSVTMPPTQMSMHFSGPANHKITQEIPVQNESSKNWTLSATCSGKGFSGPMKLEVPKGDKVAYVVTFCGPAVGNYEGTLILKNSEGQDMFDYKLSGTAEEPLAAEHLHFKCKARSKQTFSVPLQGGAAAPAKKGAESSAARTILYNVSTDLQYLSGGTTANVPMAGVGAYEFSIMCPVGGIMSGSITFTDPKSGNMFWYTLDIEVTTPKAESTIEVESEVRKAVAVNIELENPTNEELVFQVFHEGGGLLGDTTYLLPPGNFTGAVPGYELIFSPLEPGESSGRVSFVNDRVGEFWYKLHLVATEGQSVDLEMMESMLGIASPMAVAIENPLDREVQVLVEITDPLHFYTASEYITLGAFAQTTFDVFFRASSLSEIVTAEMVVSGDGFGEIRYNLSGKGLLPGVMPSVQVIAPLHEFGSHTIAFRNPFAHALPIDVVLHEDGAGEVMDGEENTAAFGLLLRKAVDLVVPAHSPLQISISFSPKRLGEYSAQAQIRSTVGGRQLLWCYPLTGLAEAGQPQYLDPMGTSCKTTLIRDVSIYLKGLRAVDVEKQGKIRLSDFDVDITSAAAQQQVMRSFRVQPLELTVLDAAEREEHGVDYAMKYRLIFEPLRSFAAQIEMVIDCKNRGRWRGQLQLEANDPEPDDIINLIAPVGGIDKVKFRLSNRFLGFSNFNAYFSNKSSPHFSVSPAQGVLAPYGSDGSEFVISFSPVTYGIKDVAYLTIVTDDAQWNYEVHGAYPDVSVDKSLIQAKTSSRR